MGALPHAGNVSSTALPLFRKRLRIYSPLIVGVTLLAAAKLAMSGIGYAMDQPYSGRDLYYVCGGGQRGPYPQEEFIRADFTGLESSVWMLGSPSGNIDIYLVGMIHQGDPEYYEGLNYLLGLMDGILVENGKPELSGSSRLHPFLDYMQGSEVFSILVHQGDGLDIYDPLIAHTFPSFDADLTMDDLISGEWRLDRYLYWLNKSVDKSFRGVLGLNKAMVVEDNSDLAALADTLANYKTSYASRVLICERDDEVMRVFDYLYPALVESEKHFSLAIPWGEAHLPDFLRRFEERGFRVKEHYFLRVFSYR